MKNGEMNGRGKMIFVDNTIFEGQFQNGKILGRGARIEPNGEVLEQEWPLTTIAEFFKVE